MVTVWLQILTFDKKGGYNKEKRRMIEMKINKLFKFVCVLLVIIISINFIPVGAFAIELENKSSFSDININEKLLSQSKDSFVRKNDDKIIQIVNNLNNLSVQELNAYIDNITYKYKYQKNIKSIDPTIPTIIELKTAWLAAAQIAKIKGYTCAAKAVEYSVLGLNYNEDKGVGGLFRDKIVGTFVYKNYFSETQKSGVAHVSKVKEFTKSDNADLFYALHNATITFDKTKTYYKVHLYDRFDFAFDNNYDSLFTSIVNNWAWLCQNTSVLNAVDINVYFTE